MSNSNETSCDSATHFCYSLALSSGFIVAVSSDEIFVILQCISAEPLLYGLILHSEIAYLGILLAIVKFYTNAMGCDCATQLLPLCSIAYHLTWKLPFIVVSLL